VNFFQYQPQVPYVFTNDTGYRDTLVMVDITTRAQILQRIQTVVSSYYDYVIADYERPDTVAVSLYGHARYTWLVLLLNNMFGLHDWPLNYEEFQRYLTTKYGSLDRAQAVTTDADYYFDATHTYVTADEYANLSDVNKGMVLPARYCFTTRNVPIDSGTYNTLSEAEQGIVLTPYEYELNANEQKRRIKFVDGRFLAAIDREYRILFRE
jgi:hypothetical protein